MKITKKTRLLAAFGPIVSDIMYDNQPFADGMDFITGDSHCLSGTNVVFAPGDRGTVRQTVDGEVKTYEFDVVNRPERCEGGVVPEMRDALLALGFVDQADGELTLRLHGGVEGSSEQVFTHRVHIWFGS